ncbi:fungal-specific transcription factor domain-containing protein [Ilyonectria destructans]|nr:fungal-specific transcription factor domain-containing protein [Ilyonectria destructans]
MAHEIPFRNGSSSDSNGCIQSARESGQAPAISCFQCRGRKVKCDRLKPNCSRCLRLGDVCVFPTSRQRRIIRKNPVGTLETRLARLEERLEQVSGADALLNDPEDPSTVNELIGLGQFEQLPPHHLTERLVALYFDELNQDAPMLHRARYTASLRRPSHMRPPMSLQYAVLALAATARQEFTHLAMPFYERSRRYADADEMKGQGEYFTTIAHTQCWYLLATYESHQLIFSRASVSLSKSVRMAQMLGLHRLDSPQQPTDPPLQPPRDHFELEERRRTWWVVFCSDRFVGGITGWPALINDKDIETRLPASDETFDMGTNEPTPWLRDALRGAVSYSPFAGKVLTAHTFYRTLEHTFRSFSNDDVENTTDGPYWTRQRGIDADLSNMILYLPESLRLPQCSWNRNAIVVNVGIHTSVICIHRAALAKIRELGLSVDLFADSTLRLLPSAEQILSALKSTGDIQGAMNDHFLVFSAYLASLIFLEDYMQTQSPQSEHNLHNLLGAMAVTGEKDPFSRSLAIQLATGMRQSRHNGQFPVLTLLMTAKQVQQLPPTSVSVPILAKRDKASAHITFCSILPSKMDDYSSSPNQE